MTHPPSSALDTSALRQSTIMNHLFYSNGYLD